jgi:hypothetical protein
MERVRRNVTAAAIPPRKRGRPRINPVVKTLREQAKGDSPQPYKFTEITGIIDQQMNYYSNRHRAQADIKRILSNNLYAASLWWQQNFSALEVYGFMQGLCDELAECVIREKKAKKKKAKGKNKS